MKTRVKILIGLIILSVLVLASGITYSVFNTTKNVSVEDQKIAKFVFDTKQTDNIQLEINNILPNEQKEFLFSVSNTSSETSNITINYQIKIHTYHFIPLEISLYKVENEEDTFMMTCDETYSRDSNNVIVCNSLVQEMKYSDEQTDNYKLVVKFEDGYNDAIYSNLVDFVDLEISSWQKIEE